MMISVLNKALVATVVIIGLSAISSQGMAEEVPIVDGKLWDESSVVEKKSYLIGASNFIVLEHEYQSRSKNPPTYYQSSVPDFFEHTENVTLDMAIEAVDDWYKNNPGSTGTPVLTVLWNVFVEPKIQ